MYLPFGLSNITEKDNEDLYSDYRLLQLNIIRKNSTSMLGIFKIEIKTNLKGIKYLPKGR